MAEAAAADKESTSSICRKLQQSFDRSQPPPGHTAPRQQGRTQQQQPSTPVDVKDVVFSASTNDGRANKGQKVLPNASARTHKAEDRKTRDKMMAELLRPRQQTHRCTMSTPEAEATCSTATQINPARRQLLASTSESSSKSSILSYLSPHGM